MARRWRKQLVRRLRLYWVGIGAIVVGAGLMCIGGYRVARSPEFLAGYRIRFIERVYDDRPAAGEDVKYYQQEIARLRSGCKLAIVGFGVFMSGIVLGRYHQRFSVRIRRAKPPLPSFYAGVANRGPNQRGEGS